MLKAGFDAAWARTEYDYFRWAARQIPNETDPAMPDFIDTLDTLSVVTRPGGREVGAYLSARTRVAGDVTLESGIRFDHQSHSGAVQLAPRVNVAYQAGQRTNIRGAWGLYHQSHGLHELWVADGDTTFYAAQRAEHRVVSVEHISAAEAVFRIELYERFVRNPLPEYRNLEDFVEGLREEGPEDRVFIRADRSRARGIEVFAKDPPGGIMDWAASYSLAQVEESIGDVWNPRPYDQRHAVNLQLTLRPAHGWSVSLGWLFHSPWPYTPQRLAVRRTVNGLGYVTRGFGSLNSERLIPYHRLDLRASKAFSVGSGTLLVYLDVFNATNRLNAQSAQYTVVSVVSDHVVTERSFHPQLELMPSLGLRWTF